MLQHLRSSTTSRALSLLLATSLLTTNCSKPEVLPSEVIMSQDVKEYSAEDLFRGLFLLQGPVAKKISYYEPILAVLNKEISKNPKSAIILKQQSELILASVKEIDPSYLEYLKSSIESKNFSQIDKALKRGGLLVKSVNLVSNKQNKSHQEQISFIKSLDASKFNLKTEEGISDFMQFAKAEYMKKYKDKGDNTANRTATDEVDMCVALFPAAVVAFAVWEVVAIVNVAAVATVALVAAALTMTLGIQEETGGDVARATNLEREMFIKQIALELQPE